MSVRNRNKAYGVAAMVLVIAIAGCGTSSASKSKPTPQGRTASGDIPDTAAYLVYHGAGYHLEYVEGWTIHLRPRGAVTINDKDSYETVSLAGSRLSTAAYADKDLRHLAATAPHYRLILRQNLRLREGASVRIQYRSLSPVDPVTGKRVAVVINRYYIPGKGKTATITLTTPAGVDNVDAFRRIAHSFRWG